MANTGYIIVTERDTNPFSPTYNQTRTRTYEDLAYCPLEGMYKIRYVRYNSERHIWTTGSKGCSTGTPGLIDQALVETIEWQGFHLRKAEIGACVTHISDYAFYGCSSLQSFYFYAETPPILGNLALDNTGNCPIYVDEEKVTAYRLAWSQYASRIQAIPNQ